MKRSIYIIIFAAMVALLTFACGNSRTAGQQAEEAAAALTVDQILDTPDPYVGDTIVVEGICSHLCRHGGRKAFLQGNADNVQIRCEAYPLMGEPFPASTVHHPMKVTGVFREERIDSATVVEMERQYEDQIRTIAAEQGEETAELAAIAANGCDTERAAQGQKDLTTFKERMDDYRTRIARRYATEGKPYLSFYYIDAISYETVE